MREIAEILRKINGKSRAIQSVICTVDSVSGGYCDVTPIDKDIAQIKKVRLNVVVDGKKGIVITPKKGSKVLVSFIDVNDAFVEMFSEVEKIEVRSGSIIFNEGQNQV